MSPRGFPALAEASWNSAGKATRATNTASYGGPNAKIKVGSKVKFADGVLVWEVVRIFDDGTVSLSAFSSGRHFKRQVSPGSRSFARLTMVDGKYITLGSANEKVMTSRGGGPDRNIEPGSVVTIGGSKVRWLVEGVLRDGTLNLKFFNGKKLVQASVGPQSKFWHSIYSVSG